MSSTTFCQWPRTPLMSIFGAPNSTPKWLGLADVGDELGGVQHRLGGNAADVQAGAAGTLAGLDQRDLDAVVGGQEGRGVTAGAAAENDELGVDCFRHGQ